MEKNTLYLFIEWVRYNQKKKRKSIEIIYT